MRKTLIAFVVLSGALLIAGSARAQLNAYEGFGYDPAIMLAAGPSNNIAGQNGGTGFQNPWLSGSGNVWGQVVAPTLNYTDGNGHSLLTSGNSLQIGTNGASSVTANPQRVFTNAASAATLGLMGAANGADPGVVWMSFLYYREGASTGAPFFRQANLGLFQGTAEKLDVGGDNTSATVNNTLSLWSNGGAHPGATPLQSLVPVFSANAQLIVLKLVVDNTATVDGVSVWFNPADITALGAPDLTSASEIDISGVNTLRFQAGNFNANGTNAVFLADEFRVGNTFTDVLPVVPEPTAIAFAAIGGFGLLVWRRKTAK